MKRRDAPRPGGSRGFSLIEIIAVVVISAFVLQGLAQITGTMLRNWGQFNRNIGDFAAAVGTAETFSREINGMIPITIASDTGPKVFFSGDAARMVFARPAIGFDNAADLNEVTYSLEPRGKRTDVIRYSGPLAVTKPIPGSAGTVRSLLAEIDGQVWFEYSPDGIAFKDRWQDRAALPAAVRIAFSLPGLPERVFRKTAMPMTDAVTACLSDSGEADCAAYLAANP